MKKIFVSLMLVMLASSWSITAAQAASFRLGGGANYWTAVDDIDIDDIDEQGFSYLVSLQYRSEFLGLQGDVEFLPDRFGEDAIAPAAYFIIGKSLYAAGGIGIVHTNSDWADDPFFVLRLGLDLELLPSLFLDINASYRFDSKTSIDEAVDDIDTDTVFLGAALRIAL